MNKKSFILALTLTLPLISFAAPAVTTYHGLIVRLKSLIDIALPLMISFAVLFTAYEAFLYIVAGTDSSKRDNAKGGIVYGVIGIFIMASIWGFVSILIGTVFSGAADYSTPTNASGEIPQLSIN